MTTFTIEVDEETMPRLMALSEACGIEPRALIASIVHDVVRDDWLSHRQDVSSRRHLN